MQKITVTNEDLSTQDFFPQSYTDEAVAEALAAATAPVSTVDAEATETESV